MRSRFLALLLFALPLRAGVLDVRLLAPANGARLEGGAPATIEWQTTQLPAHVVEWEAFLSVDGGRYYGVRVTPHLDATLQRFAFTVPNIASNDARILLRFGDEHREEELELPLRFSIRATATPPPRTRSVDEAGERGAAFWVTGTRDGSQLAYVARRTQSCAAPSVFAVRVRPLEEVEPSPEHGAVEVPPVSEITYAATRATRARPHSQRGPDRLLQTMRLNI